MPKENVTGTVPTTAKLPPLKNRNKKIEKKTKQTSIHPKRQLLTYTSLKCSKQIGRHDLDSNESLMKEKTFRKESQTPFLNFKSANNVENEESPLIDQIENNEKQNQCEKTELSPETETKFFIENERNDPRDGEILIKEKKLERKVKLLFPFLNLQKMLKVKPYRTIS